MDPGCNTDDEKKVLYDFISREGIHPVKILLTHGHFDHVLGLTECAKKYGIPVYMHPADKDILKTDDFFTRTYGFSMPVIDVDTIDIGVPVLSMHAPFEVTSKLDVYMAYRAFLAFARATE